MNRLTDFSGIDPERTAVRIGAEDLSYRRFDDDINRMSHWLVQQGLQPSQRIGISLFPDYWNWVLHLAALRLGLAVFSCRDIEVTAKQHWLKLDVVVSDHAAVPTGDAPYWRRLVLDSLLPLSQQWAGSVALVAVPSVETQSRRLVATSGTTGKPKSVMWSHGQTLQRVAQVSAGLPQGAQTRLHSLQHIGTTGGFRYPLATWQAGGCVLLNGLSDSLDTAWLSLTQSTLVSMAPSILRSVLGKWPGQWPGQAGREVTLGGGRLPLALRDDALARMCTKIILTYGSTEAGSMATGDASLIERHPGAVGFVRGVAKVQIVDAQDQPLPNGQSGMVRVASPYMVHAYEQGTDASADVFRDGWFYPGDEGVLEADGFLTILGRVGDVLNLGGKKLSLADMETALDGFEGVKDHCVLVLNLENEDRLAVVVAHEGEIDKAEMQQWIRARIPKEVSFTLVSMTSIPRNAMGKVARRELADKIIPLLNQGAEPQISVIFPVHNREEYLREALDSVLAQTFTNFELLIILDGSPPGVEAIVNSYRDPRIRVIKFPHNFGVSAARNAGLRQARAPLIALMDSDDVAMPQRFARQYAHMQAHPAVTVCASNGIKQLEDGRRGLMKFPETDGVIKSRMLIVDAALHNPTTMFRASFIRQHGLAYDSNLPRDEDYRLFVEMMRLGAHFYGLQEELLLYRRHAKNVTKDRRGADKEKTVVRDVILPLFFPELTGAEYQILLKGMREEVNLTLEEAYKFTHTVGKALKETRSFLGEDRIELSSILRAYRQRVDKFIIN